MGGAWLDVAIRDILAGLSRDPSEKSPTELQPGEGQDNHLASDPSTPSIREEQRHDVDPTGRRMD